MRSLCATVVVTLTAFALTACTGERSELSQLPETASNNAQLYAQECDEGEAASCFALGLVYQMGDDENAQGVPRDEAHARALFERACAAGHEMACDPPEGSASP